VETEFDVVTDLGHSLCNNLERSLTASSRPISYDGSEGPLPGKLWSAIDDTFRAMHGSSDTGFVPHDQLVRIINEESVGIELAEIEQSIRKHMQPWRRTRSRQAIEDESRIICHGLTSPASSPDVRDQDGQASRCLRRILATLILIERPATIR